MWLEPDFGLKNPANQHLPSTYRRITVLALFGRRLPGVSDKIASVLLEEKTFMAVRIRMKRIGAKNQPAFRIVVADGRSPRDGKCIEELGTYLPHKKGNNFTLDLDRAKYWLSKGAQPSDTVASFIKKAGKAAAVPA